MCQAKTDEEIQKAIVGMKAIESKVRPTSMFGDDNLAAFRIVLDVLENKMDLYDVDNKYDCAGVPEDDYYLARAAVDWLEGEDDDFDPIENWPLIQEEI